METTNERNDWQPMGTTRIVADPATEDQSAFQVFAVADLLAGDPDPGVRFGSG